MHKPLSSPTHQDVFRSACYPRTYSGPAEMTDIIAPTPFAAPSNKALLCMVFIVVTGSVQVHSAVRFKFPSLLRP